MKDSFGNDIPDHSFIIRHTEIPQFLQCEREWYFSSHNGMNLEPVNKSPKLRFGTCWHKALEEYYSKEANGMEPSYEDALRGFNEAIEEEKAEMYKDIGDGLYDSSIQDELAEEEHLGRVLLNHYVSFDKEERRKTPFSPVEVEKRLVIPMFGGAYVAAKLDGIGKDPAGDVLGLEHKTMSKSSKVDNPDNLMLDIQMGVQILILRELPEYPNVRGVIYNLARKQMPSGRVKNPIFGRHRVDRKKTEVNNLHHLLKEVASRMEEIMVGDRPALPNPQMYGKCTWGCGFREVCEAMNRGDDYEYLIKANFKNRTRTIIEVLEDEME